VDRDGCARSPPVEAERHQEVGGLGGGRCTVAQQFVRAECGTALDRSRHGEHCDPAFGSFASGDQTAATFAALDHHEHLDEGCEDPVAQREPKGVRSRPRRPLGDHRTSLRHGLPELAVLCRVRAVRSGAHHGNRVRPVDRERSSMRGAVDALCQAGDHHHTFLGQFVAEPGGGLSSALGGVARADDADSARVEYSEVATHEQRCRSARVVEQRCRVPGIAGNDHVDAGATTLLPHLIGLTPLARTTPGCEEIGLTIEQRGERLRCDARSGGDGERSLG
jgi:hypothetical protein